MTVIQLLALCRCLKMFAFNKPDLLGTLVHAHKRGKNAHVCSSFLRVAVCVKCCAWKASSEFLVVDSWAVPVCLILV